MVAVVAVEVEVVEVDQTLPLMETSHEITVMATEAMELMGEAVIIMAMVMEVVIIVTIIITAVGLMTLELLVGVLILILMVFKVIVIV